MQGDPIESNTTAIYSVNLKKSSLTLSLIARVGLTLQLCLVVSKTGLAIELEEFQEALRSPGFDGLDMLGLSR